MDLQTRLLSSIEIIPGPGLSGCWMWLGWRHKAGYGGIHANGRKDYAHRVSYETFKGPIPEGTEIDHLCRTKSCINPLHLEAVVHRENILRGAGNPLGRRSHCKRGHPLIEGNIGFNKRKPDAKPYRTCLVCQRAARALRGNQPQGVTT